MTSAETDSIALISPGTSTVAVCIRALREADLSSGQNVSNIHNKIVKVWAEVIMFLGLSVN